MNTKKLLGLIVLLPIPFLVGCGSIVVAPSDRIGASTTSSVGPGVNSSGDVIIRKETLNRYKYHRKPARSNVRQKFDCYIEWRSGIRVISRIETSDPRICVKAVAGVFVMQVIDSAICDYDCQNGREISYQNCITNSRNLVHPSDRRTRVDWCKKRRW